MLREQRGELPRALLSRCPSRFLVPDVILRAIQSERASHLDVRTGIQHAGDEIDRVDWRGFRRELVSLGGDDGVIVELREGDASRDARDVRPLRRLSHDEDMPGDMACLAAISRKPGNPGVHRLQHPAARIDRLGTAAEQRGHEMRLACIEKVPSALDEPARAALVVAEGIDDGRPAAQITASEQCAEHAFGQRVVALQHERLELVLDDGPLEVIQFEPRDLELPRDRVDAEDRIVAHDEGDVLAPEHDAGRLEIAHATRFEQKHGEHAAYEVKRQLLGEQALEAVPLRLRVDAPDNRRHASEESLARVVPAFPGKRTASPVLFGHLAGRAFLLGDKQIGGVYGYTVGLQGAQGITRGRRGHDNLDAGKQHLVDAFREGAGAFFMQPGQSVEDD